MKKLCLCLLFCVSLTLPMLSYADSSASMVDTHEIEIGVEASHIKYVENNLMDEQGVMYSIAASYAYHDGLMLKVDGRIAAGRVDYTSNRTGSLKNIFDNMAEMRGVAGYDFGLYDWFMVTPYAGIGYRYLQDDGSGKHTTTGHAAYNRESEYFYLPMGVELRYQLSETWFLGGHLEYDLFLQGKQASHVLGNVWPAVHNKQSSGYGYRGSVKLRHCFGSFGVSVEPFMRCWSIDSSELTYYYGALFVEPKNTSKEYGVRISIDF